MLDKPISPLRQLTYLLFFVKLGPGLGLFLVLVFAIWIGWRWLCRKAAQRGAAWPGVRLKLPSFLRRMAAGRSTKSDFSLRRAATTAFL
jgi:hypothetical protein